MTQFWEHKTAWGVAEDTDELLADHGNLGWELVAVTCDSHDDRPGRYGLFFKRPLRGRWPND